MLGGAVGNQAEQLVRHAVTTLSLFLEAVLVGAHPQPPLEESCREFKQDQLAILLEELGHKIAETMSSPIAPREAASCREQRAFSQVQGDSRHCEEKRKAAK